MPSSTQPTIGVRPAALSPLPLGALRPTGWLAGQLQRQLDGMAGSLDEFWPDVRDSAWIGGDADGWERGPYWLDGVVPLAYLTGDAGLIAKVEHWADYILNHQRADGDMGPETGDPSEDHFAAFGDYDAWPRMIVLKALLQYRSATGDPRVVPAALRLLAKIDAEIAEHPLHEWGRVRWADLLLSVLELHELTDETWLLELADRVRAQGYDWTAYALDLPYRDKVTDARLHEYQQEAGGVWMNDHFLATHGVNVAMGVKAFPIDWRTGGDDGARDAFGRLLASLDESHGQATGLFSADEHLAGRNPSQGTETCTVVELMFSLETAVETWGLDEAVIDRLERIAFNALPASARSDEWAHQYDQQSNQVICHITEDRIYTNNGPDSNTFALEPNFGCCTANRHQGWPKLAARLWLRAADGGLAALSYAPCVIDTDAGGSRARIEVSGGYPFGDEISIDVTTEDAVAFPLHLRIPGWAIQPTVTVDGVTLAAEPGTVQTVERDWSGAHRIVLSWDANVRRRTGYNDATTLLRGPLVFSMPVAERWRVIGGELPHATWAVEPGSPWNVGIIASSDSIQADLVRLPIGDEPFTPEGAPLALEVATASVPGWTYEHGAAAVPPQSPALLTGPVQRIRMLPYGAARLRITELPWAPAVEDVE